MKLQFDIRSFIAFVMTCILFNRSYNWHAVSTEKYALLFFHCCKSKLYFLVICSKIVLFINLLKENQMLLKLYDIVIFFFQILNFSLCNIFMCIISIWNFDLKNIWFKDLLVYFFAWIPTPVWSLSISDDITLSVVYYWIFWSQRLKSIFFIFVTYTP